MDNLTITTNTDMILEPINNSFKFLYSPWIFTLAAALIIYSIYIWKKSEDNFMTKFKRVYYSCALLLYLIFIRFEDVSTWCITGMIGINPVVWSYLFSMVTSLVVAILIDNFIISGYAFKEFGFMGAKFIKEDLKKDTEENLGEQKKYIMTLEKDLTALYDVPSYIDEIFNSPTDISKKITKDNSLFITYFSEILNKYYKFKNEMVSISVKFYKTEDIKDILRAYETNYSGSITKKDIENITNCLLGETQGQYLRLGEYKVFIISQDINFGNQQKKLMVSIKAIDEINIYDIYPVLNFLYIFLLKLQ